MGYIICIQMWNKNNVLWKWDILASILLMKKETLKIRINKGIYHGLDHVN